MDFLTNMILSITVLTQNITPTTSFKFRHVMTLHANISSQFSQVPRAHFINMD